MAQQKGSDIGDVDAPVLVAWTWRTCRLARTTLSAGWTSCLGLRLTIFPLSILSCRCCRFCKLSTCSTWAKQRVATTRLCQSTSSGRTPGWLHSGYRRARSPSLVGPTLELRIIRLSCNGRRKSCWMPEFFRHGVSASAAPVVFALKKDGKLRLCIDYRLLNAWTVRDHVPSGVHQSAQNSG